MAHVPVLLREVLKIFEDIQLKVFFEGTVGAGGHAKAILEAHPEIERYLACDRDPTAHKIAAAHLEPWGKKVEWIRGPYADLEEYLEEKGIREIDGYLIDIGVSSMQIDSKERGFSFQGDAPLDMRMDPESDLTAERIVNETSEKELARIFFEYGEERRSRQVARAIVEARRKRKIRTTSELIAIVKPVTIWGKLHPATLVFQALRIVVNDELGELKRGLDGAIRRTREGGRIAAISFHSLEDRIVKNTFRDAKDQLEILTKKPIGPTEEEKKKNPRSRSAKLRAAEKKNKDVMKNLLLRLGVCFTVSGFCLYSYLDMQNDLTELKIKLPELDQDFRLIREENRRLSYEVDEFQSPSHLMELARRPEFSHLKHPILKEILTVPEPLAASSD